MFHAYVLFLIASGVMMLVMACIMNGAAPVRKIWYIVLGIAFTVYGLYLLLFFHGSRYFLFFYAFILPVMMIVQFFRDRSRRRAPVLQGVPGHGQPRTYEQQPADGAVPGTGN